ncbi:hypothetical protein PENANT_c023G09096 [Penicillium antarcticum]|uniref:Uncharacterized protein n=1 Tax=Penicillium antarcticum TaxID=416450 RepID=A0A1V6PYM4_9EURO|nr:hypothetical protein PENANT_c023G09096 [Penicillium antarcticum]
MASVAIASKPFITTPVLRLGKEGVDEAASTKSLELTLKELKSIDDLCLFAVDIRTLWPSTCT